MTYLNKLLTAASVTTVSIGFLVIAGTGTALANGTGGGISSTNSPHNFADNIVGGLGEAAVADSEIGGAGWNFRGEICRVCHVPHDHARATFLLNDGLLWNHALSSETYTMYDTAWSNTLSLAAQDPAPTGNSKLCLGCHDGTIAIDQFDNNIAVTTGATIDTYDPSYEVSGQLDGGNIDLRGTHPISITYDEALLGLNPTGDTMGTSGLISDVLQGGKVQCSSCHDVHDEAAVAGTHLLRVSQTATPSGLCLVCHNK